MTTVEMCVHMDCSGCETRIRKALQKLKGVDQVEVDMVRQKVTVTGWADRKKVLKAVRKTGRRAVLWPYSSGDNMYYYNQANSTPAVTGYYVQQQQQHPAFGPAPTSSYNYYKHGYDDMNGYGYGYGYGYDYQRQGYGAGYSVVGDGARSAFSDENPHACSIM